MTGASFLSVWGSGADDVWAVGQFGTVLHRDSGGWTRFPSLTAKTLSNLTGSGPRDVWALAGGEVYHWDGRFWLRSSRQPPGRAYALWAAGLDDLWAAGDDGLFFHWDGRGWTSHTSPTRATIYSIHGVSPSDIWALGTMGGHNAPPLLHWNGQEWSLDSLGQRDLILEEVWGRTSRDFWAFGPEGAMMHWDGHHWQTIPLRAHAAKRDDAEGELHPVALWASSANDAWLAVRPDASPNHETLYHWNGARWSPVPVYQSIQSLWGAGPNDVWAVGSDGVILRLISPEAPPPARPARKR